MCVVCVLELCLTWIPLGLGSIFLLLTPLGADGTFTQEQLDEIGIMMDAMIAATLAQGM